MRSSTKFDEVNISQVINLVGEWVEEIQTVGFEKDWNLNEIEIDEEEDDVREEILKAWDDVHGGKSH